MERFEKYRDGYDIDVTQIPRNEIEAVTDKKFILSIDMYDLVLKSDIISLFDEYDEDDFDWEALKQDRQHNTANAKGISLEEIQDKVFSKYADKQWGIGSNINEHVDNVDDVYIADCWNNDVVWRVFFDTKPMTSREVLNFLDSYEMEHVNEVTLSDLV